MAPLRARIKTLQHDIRKELRRRKRLATTGKKFPSRRRSEEQRQRDEATRNRIRHSIPALIKAFDATKDGRKILARLRRLRALEDVLLQSADRIEKHPLNDPAHSDVRVKIFRTNVSPGNIPAKRRQARHDEEAFQEAMETAAGSCMRRFDGSEYYTRALHLFPVRHSGTMMQHLFGMREQYCVNSGLGMEGRISYTFEKSLWALVPDIPGDLSSSSIRAWRQQKPRAYRILVLQPRHGEMNKTISRPTEKEHEGTTYAQVLEGAVPQWSSNLRPRTRYLYYHYVKCVMALAYSEFPHPDVTEEERKRPCWAHVGSYLKQSEIKSIKDHLGPDFAGILGEGLPDDGDQSSLQTIAYQDVTSGRSLGRDEPRETGGRKDLQQQHSAVDPANDGDLDGFCIVEGYKASDSEVSLSGTAVSAMLTDLIHVNRDEDEVDCLEVFATDKERERERTLEWLDRLDGDTSEESSSTDSEYHRSFSSSSSSEW